MGLPPRIVMASGNPGKLRELAALLEGWRVQLLPQTVLGVTDADETGMTFLENALIKARHAATGTGLPAIADDSGIEVDALGGAPGVRSARFAGPDATDAQNLDLLLARIRDMGVTRPAARFRCVVAFVRHAADPVPVVAHGTWEGWIVDPPAGAGGFGYDPVFFVPTHGCTSAQLPPAEKNRISHRGQALAMLRKELGRHLCGPDSASNT